jgi:DDE superfamily endonuclease
MNRKPPRACPFHRHHRQDAYTAPYKKPKGGALTAAEQKAYNRALSQVRVRIEHCIGWIKNWAIIATRFRRTHGIYTAILRTVCGLVNAQTLRWQAACVYKL